ncbi:histidine kinase [Aquimarina sp. TRL1]|uniref:sensor histidine kinase n=1 Tax=Aquimarina sp. (strain TRL1) TaxID=2736252 RepID=UPI00158A0158|nr:ATP-binding protein [Aquimarina sp. TRL1]QKX05097.1 histidine kinase [Aquimarina sp. TRL1]
MQRQETAILIASITLIVLVVLIIFLFLIFQKRKNSLLEQQAAAKKVFEKALAETQIEIREETLRNISWELHDNIGQLLTLAKIQVNIAQDDPERLPEVTDTISKSLKELRALSKLINPDAIKNLSLTEALSLEIERFNRLQFIAATMNVEGELRLIDGKAEIIIFRILQEFFSNTIKHSKADELNVLVHYKTDRLEIKARDNGIGFNQHTASPRQGIGLLNMQSRGKLINAVVKLHSREGEGTAILLTYYYKKPIAGMEA